MDVLADLHIHSTASDGSFSPVQVAEICAKKGIQYAALTDHDTVLGVKDFLQAADRLHLKATTGVEFSVQYGGELHILAYRVDIDAPRFLSVLKDLGRRRADRAKRIVAKLQKAGMDISLAEVSAQVRGEVIGRPHIGRVLADKGYANSVSDAFTKYLNCGCPGFVERYSLTEQEAIHAIKNAGGLAVLAHPKLTFSTDFDALIQRLKNLGLDGIEAFYPLHTAEECTFFSRLGEKYGLFLTQGSDAHGDMRNTTYIGKEMRGKTHMEDAISRLF